MSSEMVRVSDDLELHVTQSGSGETPVVFVPGWTMSSRVFEEQLAFFSSSTEFRFISFDPRAHGQSTKTQTGHTYEQHARDLHSLVTALQLEQIVLAGWSFGTLATLGYINQFGSDRLSGLVMLDGPAKAVGRDPTTEWFTYYADDDDGAMEFFTMGRLRDQAAALDTFAHWLFEEPTTAKVEWAKNIAIQTPDSASSLLNASSRYANFQDDLLALEKVLPLLYVVREERRSTIEPWAQRFTPAAMFAAFGGHMMFKERSDEFNAVLLDFLRRLADLRPPGAR